MKPVHPVWFDTASGPRGGWWGGVAAPPKFSPGISRPTGNQGCGAPQPYRGSVCASCSSVHTLAEFGGGEAERFSELGDVFNAGIPQPAFDAADVGGVESRLLGEFFLGEFAGFASHLRRFSPSFASTESRFGMTHSPSRNDGEVYGGSARLN